jgi:gluconokinase
MSAVLDDVVGRVEPALEYISVTAGTEPAVVLSLDIGSSGVRAALFDEHGSEIRDAEARTSRAVSPLFDSEELDAEQIVADAAATIDSLLAKPQLRAVRIDLVAISCFWHSLVGVDADGRTTTPLLSWADTRAGNAAEQLKLRLEEREFHNRTGCRFHPSYWPAKLLWLKEERPDVFASTKRWLSLADYFFLRLFGETVTSVSMASGTGLLDQRSCEWDQEIVEQLGITIDTLPEIATPDRTLTGLRYEYDLRWPQLHQASFFPAISDGGANNIGSACVGRDKIALMVGTSGAMRVLYKGDPPSEIPTGLWSYRVDRDRVLVGSALSDGGGLYAWMKQTLVLPQDDNAIEQALAEMEPDAHGLTMLPLWAGERGTGWTSNASGGIIGLTQRTHPIEIVRAAMEAVAYRFALIAEQLEPIAPNATIIASGNALKSSPTWTQILSDVLGRPICLSGTREASTRGAALLALEARGKIQSIESTNVAVTQVFEPDLQRHARYRQGLERQRRLYDDLAWRFAQRS